MRLLITFAVGFLLLGLLYLAAQGAFAPLSYARSHNPGVAGCLYEVK